MTSFAAILPESARTRLFGRALAFGYQRSQFMSAASVQVSLMGSKMAALLMPGTLPPPPPIHNTRPSASVAWAEQKMSPV